MTSELFYTTHVSPFGPFSLVWQEAEAGPRLLRIFLSNAQALAEDRVRMGWSNARSGANPVIGDLGERMQRFLEGEALDFELTWAALETCSAFQQRVLRAEHQIPRGWVSTYNRIAAHLGVPGGARAVGNALAHNPFPILIPCHRAIRADGSLGGYQGGTAMKRTLLEREGVMVSPAGKVALRQVYY
ncbi:MAG TPA: methylated-DNA--[protein]-cysteine S-methyltransferase [Anaerolineae bacterium]|nr:methylated-DNA--[protein]-cysteine S-methyltransferase [Anaerolineae bacterium]